MGRILLLMLTMGIVAWIAYSQIKGSPDKTAPKQTLDRAHEAADKVEADLQKNADAIEKRLQE